MQPRVLIGLGAVAIGLVGYAIAVSQTPPRAAHEPAPAAQRRPPPPAHDFTGPTVADAVQRALEPPPEPELKLPPAAARRAAEASFEAAMTTLEQLADAGKRVPRARREQLYRETNDAFAALSITLDATDAADLQALEDANIRMKVMLREVGVRVPKRPLAID
jgi:hypothetical protein